MIRWKQAQIHKERREREDQRDLLRMELEATARFLKEMPARVQGIRALPSAAIAGFLTALGAEVDKEYTDPMRCYLYSET